MNFLQHLRISHKISALMIGLIFGFIAIGVTYYIQINVDKANRNLERGSLGFQSSTAELGMLQAQITAQAERYITTGDPAALQRYNALSEQYNVLTSTANASAVEVSLGKAFNQVTTAAKQHANAISQLAPSEAGLAESTAAELEQTMASLNALVGSTNSQEAIMAFSKLQELLEKIKASASPTHIQGLNDGLSTFREKFLASTFTASQQQEFAELSGSLQNSISLIDVNEPTASPEQLASVQALAANWATASNELLSEAKQKAETTMAAGSEKTLLSEAAVTAIIFVVALGTTVGVYLIYKSIIFPMAHMQSVIRRINRGKSKTRVKMMSHDEMGDLGTAFNKLLDERIQQLEDQSKENDKLNNSIISLIRALGMIARKDLTIKVPVSSDITGTISDAVNLLTTETAKTLHSVRDISEEVNGVSAKLQEQSTVVMQFADNERRQIQATSKALEVLARAMTDVAAKAGVADTAATEAIESTQEARKTVLETVSGIRTIRETISETEKRMKRLGDRSQEISGIVNLINTIAERTHILALNASMHAASAGEAGRGFAVVADEVQRLAESARQSTDEISAMVNNIRIETSDTVTLMNTLISQVADGSRLAEQAGKKMEDTESATRTLVLNVQSIAEHATQQAEVANRVKDRAAIIRTISEKTGKQLAAQKEFTDSLHNCAETLLERVNVFSLPEMEREERVVTTGANVTPIQSAG